MSEGVMSDLVDAAKSSPPPSPFPAESSPAPSAVGRVARADSSCISCAEESVLGCSDDAAADDEDDKDGEEDCSDDHVV